MRFWLKLKNKQTNKWVVCAWVQRIQQCTCRVSLVSSVSSGHLQRDQLQGGRNRQRLYNIIHHNSILSQFRLGDVTISLVRRLMSIFSNDALSFILLRRLVTLGRGRVAKGRQQTQQTRRSLKTTRELIPFHATVSSSFKHKSILGCFKKTRQSEGPVSEKVCVFDMFLFCFTG